ncbi:C-type lectin fold, partial [Gonioctena quinquepunctata]
ARSNLNETDNFQYTFDKYYFFQTVSKQTWEGANQFCRVMDMGLAAIETEEENTQLARWIGLQGYSEFVEIPIVSEHCYKKLIEYTI